MENVLNIFTMVSAALSIVYIIFVVRESKSPKMFYLVGQTIFVGIILVLQIVILILKIILKNNCTNYIILIGIWSLGFICNLLTIFNEISKQKDKDAAGTIDKDKKED